MTSSHRPDSADADARLFVAANRPRRPLPFRPRESMPEDAMRFTDGQGFELFVTRDAQEALRRGTSRGAPAEVFALLRGRAFRDARGEYTVVNGVLYPPRQSRGPAHVHLSAVEAAVASNDAEREFFLEDPVGWSHSHGRYSDYSLVDREEQATWPANHHVGILTFMEGEPWLRAYHGPESRELRRAEAAATASLAPVASATPVAPTVAAARAVLSAPGPMEAQFTPLTPVRMRGKPRRRPARAPRLTPRVRAAAAFLLAAATVLLFAIAVVIALWLTRHQPGEPPLAWSCGPTGPLTVECRGPLEPSIQKWTWSFDDGAVLHGRTVSHRFESPGVRQVTLDVETDQGPANEGTQEVAVPDISAPALDLPQGCRAPRPACTVRAPGGGI